MIVIYDPIDNPDFWDVNRQVLSQNRYSPPRSEPPDELGQAVRQTTSRVAKGAYNSPESRQEPLFNKELQIVCAVMFLKVLLWVVYREAQSMDLEIFNL
ncbi:MAG: hypothetical protein HPY50_00390 [Firmicutes bacterium]|nr:hypothetical protein [Bacillota bacterium]